MKFLDYKSDVKINYWLQELVVSFFCFLFCFVFGSYILIFLVDISAGAQYIVSCCFYFVCKISICADDITFNFLYDKSDVKINYWL